MTATAADRLFNTFELVEAILLQICDASSRNKGFSAAALEVFPDGRSTPYGFCDMPQLRNDYLKSMMTQHTRAHARELRDLFQLEAVNTIFRNVVVSSKKLRKDMFRKTSVAKVKRLRSDFWDKWDDLLRYINPVAFELEKIVSFRVSNFEFLPINERNHSADPASDEERAKTTELDVIVTLESAFKEPPKCASWRSMLFAKSRIECQVSFLVFAGRSDRGIHVVQLNEGATLGDFVDGAVEAIKKKAGDMLEMRTMQWHRYGSAINKGMCDKAGDILAGR